MNEQGPGAVSSCVEFNPSGPSAPEVRGGLSKDGKLSHMYDGSVISVYDTENGQLVVTHDFRHDTDSDTTVDPPSILSVCEFNPCCLLIGLDSGNGLGELVLLNLPLNKIIRRVSLPAAVTALETVDCFSTSPNQLVTGLLKTFHGIIAAGTKTGGLFVIDLCLDISFQAGLILTPYFISLEDNDTEINRTSLAEINQVIGYSLAYEGDDYFCYSDPAGQITHQMSLDEVYVSCLKFVPQLSTLCVGYNFGSFQLYRVDPLVLDYSSSYQESNLAVSHITYQEPENDPRSFCYLWVSRCAYLAHSVGLSTSLDEFICGSVANLSLYQLAYESKKYCIDDQVVYTDLAQVGCAFTHELAPARDVMTSWVLSCETLTNVKSLQVTEDDSQLEHPTSDTPLVQLSWRVRHHDGIITSHLALFDINRWYHAQMPNYMRQLGGWCSYFSQYAFDEPIADRECLSVRVSSSTISSYKCPRNSQQERFHHPSSLSFYAEFLTSDGVVTICYFGIQRQSLHDVRTSALQSILEPRTAFSLLKDAGLISNNTQDVNIQRKAILTVLLQHTCTEALTKLITQLSKHDSRHAVNLNFFSDWLWETLQKIIKDFDQRSMILYDWSGIVLEDSHKQTLLQLKCQTINIRHLYSHLIQTLEESARDKELSGGLNEKIGVLEKRLTHMMIVTWMSGINLLPEMSCEITKPGLFSYPLNSLRRTYNNLNSQLLLINSGMLNGSRHTQMIDKLMLNISGISQLFKDEGGTAQYPPPNLRALLSIFLLPGNVVSHMCIFIYTLLDLIAVIDYRSLDENLHQLLIYLSDNYREINRGLYHVVLAYWYADHHEFKDIMTALKQPDVERFLSSSDVEYLLESLVVQGQLAVSHDVLMYIRHNTDVCIERSHLVADILIYNGALEECFQYSKQLENSDKNDILSKLMNKTGIGMGLSRLLCLPLDSSDCNQVRSELENTGSLDKLVIHHLQTGNVCEAVKINNLLKTQPMWKGDDLSKKRSVVREKIINLYVSQLPPIRQKLLTDPSYLSLKHRTKYLQPKLLKPMLNKETRRDFINPVELARSVYNVQKSPDPSDVSYLPFINTLTPSHKSRTTCRTAPVLRAGQRTSISGILEHRETSKRKLNDGTEAPDRKTIKSHSGQPISRSAVKKLLRTPLVKRRSPRHSRTVQPVLATPHSILKIRKPQILTSPSISQSPTLLFNQNRDSLSRTAPKSASRVRWKAVDSPDRCSPKVICFDEEEDEVVLKPAREDSLTTRSEMNKSGDDDDDSEIQFASVETNHSNTISDSSFMSAEEERPEERILEKEDLEMKAASTLQRPRVTINVDKPLVKVNILIDEKTTITTTQTTDSNQPTNIDSSDIFELSPKPAAVKISPSKLSPPKTPKSGAPPRSPSSADSNRSLTALDQEARLTGLDLREVRQSEICKERTHHSTEFIFSPVQRVADASFQSSPISTSFLFSKPKQTPAVQQTPPPNISIQQTTPPNVSITKTTTRKSTQLQTTSPNVSITKTTTRTSTQLQTTPKKRHASPPNITINQTTPNRSITPPTKVKTPPTQVRTPPTKVRTPPSKVKTPPSKVKTLPPKVKSPRTKVRTPKKVKTPTKKDKTSLEKGLAAPTTVKTLPTKVITLPKDVKTSPTKVTTPPTKVKTPPKNDKTPLTKVIPTPTAIKTPPTKVETPPTEGSSSQVEVTTVGKSESILQNKIEVENSVAKISQSTVVTQHRETIERFYFSPVQHVSSPAIVIPSTQQQQQQFQFSQPSDARTTRSTRQRKPIRPFKLIDYENEEATKTDGAVSSSRLRSRTLQSSAEDDINPGDPGRNRKPIKPIEITIPDSVYTVEKRVTRRRQTSSSSDPGTSTAITTRSTTRTSTRKSTRKKRTELKSEQPNVDDDGVSTADEVELPVETRSGSRRILPSVQEDGENNKPVRTPRTTRRTRKTTTSSEPAMSEPLPETELEQEKPARRGRRTNRSRLNSDSSFVSETTSVDSSPQTRTLRNTRQASLPPVLENPSTPRRNTKSARAQSERKHVPASKEKTTPNQKSVRSSSHSPSTQTSISRRNTRASRLSPILSPSALEEVLKTPRRSSRRKL